MLTVHTTAAGDIIHNITMRQRVGVQGFALKSVKKVIENSNSKFSPVAVVSWAKYRAFCVPNPT